MERLVVTGRCRSEREMRLLLYTLGLHYCQVEKAVEAARQNLDFTLVAEIEVTFVGWDFEIKARGEWIRWVRNILAALSVLPVNAPIYHWRGVLEW